MKGKKKKKSYWQSYLYMIWYTYQREGEKLNENCIILCETRRNKWSEDTFYSMSLDESIEYIYRNGYTLGEDADIAKYLINDEGIIVECLEIITGI